jgi:hypothetical protein
MSDGLPSAPTAERRNQRWWLIAGYFVVFFSAMGLGGLLFLLGGIAIILIPGSLPVWAQVGYVLLGIAGSIAIAVVAANSAFRLALNRQDKRPSPVEASVRSRIRPLAWLAGIAGTAVAGVLSASLTTVVSRWFER